MAERSRGMVPERFRVAAEDASAQRGAAIAVSNSTEKCSEATAQGTYFRVRACKR
jgi:hypothetical protein